MFRSSPRMCRIMSSGCTPSLGDFVMRAAGAVHVMIARIPTVIRQLDPPLEPKAFAVRGGVRNFNVALEDSILGSARVCDAEFARRQQHEFAALPVHLILKEEVGGQTPCARGIDAAVRIAEDELSGRRLAIVVEHFERDSDRRLALAREYSARCESRGLASPGRHRTSAFASRWPASRLYISITRYSSGRPDNIFIQRLRRSHFDIEPALADGLRRDRLLRIGLASRLLV